MAKLRNLKDILPPEFTEGQAAAVEDYLDKPLIFKGCRELSGKNGTYLRIQVTLPDSEDVFIISTGASQPMGVLKWAAENNQFPFLAHFEAAGQAYLLVG